MKKIIALLLVMLMGFSLCACDTPLDFADEISDFVAEGLNFFADDDNGGETGIFDDDNDIEYENEINKEILRLTKGNDYLYSQYKELPVPVRSECDNFALDEEYAELYPELNSALKENRTQNSEKNENEFNDLKDMAKDFPDDLDNMELTAERNLYLRRADERAFSYIGQYYAYYGGAHGSYYTWGESFDTKSGKKLTLSDITSDKTTLAAVIYKHLCNNYDKTIFFDINTVDEYIEENMENIPWVLEYIGVSFFFNPYELAPFASGTQIVTIPFNEIPSLVCKDYVETPQEYAYELIGAENYFNLDGGDTLNKINPISSEYMDGTTVSIDDNSTSIDEYAYFADFFLVHMDDGENYLYTQCSYDGDSASIYVHELNSYGCSEISHTDDGLRYIFYNRENDNVRHTVLTDPGYFEVGDTLSVLSTVYGHRSCFVDSYGKPSPLPGNEYYVVDEEQTIELTLKQDLKAEEIDVRSNDVKGSVSLNTGDKIIYFRSDNHKTADFKTSDGKIVRLKIDAKNTWPYTIDGVDIEEIFDGLLFAG